MKRSELFFVLVLFVLVVGASVFISLNENNKQIIKNPNAKAKLTVYPYLFTNEQMCQTIQKESLLEIPDEKRTFPYLRLKEGVNCLK